VSNECLSKPEWKRVLYSDNRWTLHLLADRLVALQVVDAIRHECVRSALKRTNLLIDVCLENDLVEQRLPPCFRPSVGRPRFICRAKVNRPHLRVQRVIPPQQNADLVATMEDVLEVKKQPYDPRGPQVCLDEQSKQLVPCDPTDARIKLKRLYPSMQV
jgi:hypothetical protein